VQDFHGASLPAPPAFSNVGGRSAAQAARRRSRCTKLQAAAGRFCLTSVIAMPTPNERRSFYRQMVIFD